MKFGLFVQELADKDGEPLPVKTTLRVVSSVTQKKTAARKQTRWIGRTTRK